jgi:ankyrin repeat protein
MQEDGRTALHMASENGHMGIVKALLAAGADVSATLAVRGLVLHVCGGPQDSRCIGLVLSVAMKPGRITWGRCVLKRIPLGLGCLFGCLVSASRV